MMVRNAFCRARVIRLQGRKPAQHAGQICFADGGQLTISTSARCPKVSENRFLALYSVRQRKASFRPVSVMFASFAALLMLLQQYRDATLDMTILHDRLEGSPVSTMRKGVCRKEKSERGEEGRANFVSQTMSLWEKHRKQRKQLRRALPETWCTDSRHNFTATTRALNSPAQPPLRSCDPHIYCSSLSDAAPIFLLRFR